ncbi:uncharacterized protein J3D65DRAFT_526631, partial [Phyllosticta citribraziliensis]
SQNTAPVHEFACLYTHDLRRKQKRWHDGFLKFHTFNKRAMVYDQSRNHIGDTYWKEGNQMQEGDELTLENGVIVEVAEPKSTTQTDLTPILRKRPVPASSSGAVAQPPNRPLSAVLGTPKGPLGKAQLPIRSPFEERQRNDWTARERATKRQRVAQVPPQRKNAPPQPMAPPMRQTPLTDPSLPRSKDVIDLTSDVEEPMSSDVTIPNTPPDLGRPPGRKNTPSPRPRTLNPPPSPSRVSSAPSPPALRSPTARRPSAVPPS